MSITIANKNYYKGDGFYVGRPSPLGNPFALKKGKFRICPVDSLSDALSNYDLWLDEQLRDNTSEAYKYFYKIFNEYIDKKEITLICWCFPKKCHADIIKNKILERSLW